MVRLILVILLILMLLGSVPVWSYNTNWGLWSKRTEHACFNCGLDRSVWPWTLISKRE